ncbi:MAG: cyclase family protein [Firmicutes bacterium]|nr:cyclase family protein [Bacillota bacterium]
MKIIDLTQKLEATMPVFPGSKPPELESANTIEKDGFRQSKLTIYSHHGTHIDAPAHMQKEGKTIDQFSLDKYFGQGIVMDFSKDYVEYITLDMIRDYEKHLKKAEFVLLKTGWSKYWGEEEYFGKFPVLTEEAAKLIASFNLKGIGVDAISVDELSSTTFSKHHIFMSKEIIIIENLTNLDALEEKFWLSIMPLKTDNADGSLVRAYAVIM